MFITETMLRARAAAKAAAKAKEAAKAGRPSIDNPYVEDGWGNIHLDYKIAHMKRHYTPSKPSVYGDPFINGVRAALRAMEQKKEDRRYTVPFKSLMKLCDLLHGEGFNGFGENLCHRCFSISDRNMSIMLIVLQELLIYGVDLTEAPQFPLVPARNILSLHNALSQLEGQDVRCMEIMLESNILLFSYGNRLDESWFSFLLQIVQLNPEHFKEDFLHIDYHKPSPSSLKPNEPKGLLLACKQFVTYAVITMDTRTQHMFQNRLSAVVPPVNFCLPLMQQCLRALYDYVPERRMAAHVQSFSIPDKVKEFLIFGTELEKVKHGLDDPESLRRRSQGFLYM